MACRDVMPHFTKLRHSYRSLERLESAGADPEARRKKQLGKRLKQKLSRKGKGQGEDTRGLLSNSEGDEEMGDFGASTPAWVNSLDDIGQQLKYLKRNLGDLSKLHARHLRVTFADDSDASQDVQQVTSDVSKGLIQCEQRIKALYSSHESLENLECRVRSNAQMHLASELSTLSISFRSEQARYLQKLKERERSVEGYVTDNSKVDEAFRDRQGYAELQMAAAEFSEDYTIQRHREITEVVDSVKELNQMFRELAVLVVDQGTLVDRIDYRVEHVAETTKQGVVELQKAERTQKKGSLMKCIIILAVLVGIMTLLLFFKILGKLNGSSG